MKQNSSDELQAASRQVSSYQVELYRLGDDGKLGAVVFEESGSSAAELPSDIERQGYSKSLYIHLNEYWQQVLQNREPYLSTKVTTRETIIKFGDTQQLVDNYQLIISLTYSN